MRFLFILDNYLPYIGGAEVLFSNLCKGLVAKGSEVTVITSNSARSKKFEIVDGVRVFRIGRNRYLFMVLSLYRIFREMKRADRVHTSTYTAALPAWCTAKLLRKKIHITVHEVWGAKFWLKIGAHFYLHYLFEKLIMSLRFDSYVAVSESTKKHLKNMYAIPDNKIVVIHPGIETSFSQSVMSHRLTPEKYNFLYLGRPGYAKGLEVLLRALALIKTDTVVLHLLLSKKPERRYRAMISLITHLQLWPKINILEPVDREGVKKYIRQVDCVVVPSLREGFGFSAVESCALGTPIICSNVDSLPEVIFGKVLFFEVGNSFDLSKKMQHAQEGTFDILPYKKYSWQKNIDSYYQL